MDICTASANPSGCGHYNVTVTVDGVPVSVHIADTEMLEPLTADELRTFVLLSMRRLRQKGVTLGQFINRVTHGEEATNVKTYNLIAPGSAITKTNIGAAYTNVLPGANGERSLIDFTGCTEFRVVLNANLVGTGQWGARVVKDSDSAVLFEQANLGAAGERELDSGWQTIPAGFTGLEIVRLQAKSQTAADDPVFRRCVVLVR
jgi:hypothetical protein